MIGRLGFVGMGMVCLTTVAIVPGTLAAPPVSPGQPPVFAAPVQDEALPTTPLNPYTPPPCLPGVPFADITCTTGFDPWIEQFGKDGITAGCGGGNYCPGSPVTRDQMAVFIEKAMRGTGTWSPGDLDYGNTGLGAGSLVANATGDGNTGLGAGSLAANATGSYNVGVGAYSLFYNTRAGGNVAVGAYALWKQSYDPGSLWDSGNTAVGFTALYSNQPTATFTGIHNTAVGASSLYYTTNAFNNTAIGFKAGARGGDTIIGYGGTSVTFVNTQIGGGNTFVGIAGSTAEVSNCTAVGIDAYCDATGQVRLGNHFNTSIGGKVGWSALSDARAKTDVRDLDLGLEFVLALRPVSYHLKGGNGRTDMGFVAQDIEALMGDDYNVLDIGGDKDRTLSLRYTDLIAPMVKAIQEQQATIETQQAQIDALNGALSERDGALERRLAALEQKKQ